MSLKRRSIALGSVLLVLIYLILLYRPRDGRRGFFRACLAEGPAGRQRSGQPANPRRIEDGFRPLLNLSMN